MARKSSGKKITALTAYDAPFARLVDHAGIDIVLVGDTVGVVVQGGDSTLPVTMAQMGYHTQIVARAVRRALVVGDMPFLSYQVSVAEAVRNAGRLLQAGAAAVKLEGGVRMVDRIEALVQADIPVMAHIGLTPQSIHRMGGYRVQGRDAPDALLADAARVAAAGAFCIVLEGIPMDQAARITASVPIPTIGIGAGPHCDGQVLVLHDLLGLSTRRPRFARPYANFSGLASEAFAHFKRDVESGRFPSEDESYR